MLYLTRLRQSRRVVNFYYAPIVFHYSIFYAGGSCDEIKVIFPLQALLEQQPVGEALMVWIDGERNLLEIYDRLCLDEPGADLKLLWRYFDTADEGTESTRR